VPPSLSGNGAVPYQPEAPPMLRHN
jgi:hypothetical protein